MRDDPRRERGRYDTPDALAEAVVDAALAPALDAALASPEPERALLALAVCDPACGGGNLLVAAGRRMASRLARLRHGDAHDAAQCGRAFREVARRCLHGVDRDADAVRACRARLLHDEAPAAAGVREADALAAARDGAWPELFARVWSSGGFDVVLGNPPFLNAIRSAPRLRDRAFLRALHPELGGTSDAAAHFLALAEGIRRPGGRVAMVLPRALLAAPATERMRARLTPSVTTLCAPERADLFEGASVYVALVALGPRDADGCCRFTRDPDLAGARWRRAPLTSPRWWEALVDACEGAESAPEAPVGDALGEAFEVTASMTTAEAYAIRAHLVDARDADGAGLVTSGLIDPGRILWGESRCRYLGRTMMHPRLAASGALPASVARRVARALRPKVLVAGLGARVEAALDADGRFVGAVSTFTITHPRDDVGALRALEAALRTERATRRLRAELGANALGGGGITVTRAFLRALRLPAAGA